MRDTKKKLAVVVKAAGTTLTAVRAVRQRCIRGIAVTRVVWQGTG
jgi:thiamine monophosphate synthase